MQKIKIRKPDELRLRVAECNTGDIVMFSGEVFQVIIDPAKDNCALCLVAVGGKRVINVASVAGDFCYLFEGTIVVTQI